MSEEDTREKYIEELKKKLTEEGIDKETLDGFLRSMDDLEYLTAELSYIEKRHKDIQDRKDYLIKAMNQSMEELEAKDIKALTGEDISDIFKVLDGINKVILEEDELNKRSIENLDKVTL
jgi:hypothetical protein